jgi:hypothetical protein
MRVHSFDSVGIDAMILPASDAVALVFGTNVDFGDPRSS